MWNILTQYKLETQDTKEALWKFLQGGMLWLGKTPEKKCKGT